METLLLVFWVFFYTGVGLTLISLIFGNLFHFIHFEALDFDLDGGGSGGLPFSPMIAVLFAAVFGGIGVILVKFTVLPGLLCVIISAAAAWMIGYFVQHFIFRPLKRAQNTSAPDSAELIGLPARVNESIPEKGFGEITYVINGNSYSAPAKSVDDKEIMRSCEVSICWIKEHTFYVTPISDYLSRYNEKKTSQ